MHTCQRSCLCDCCRGLLYLFNDSCNNLPCIHLQSAVQTLAHIDGLTCHNLMSIMHRIQQGAVCVLDSMC